MFVLFSLFVILPILEIMLIIQVSDSIGGWNTFLLVVITAFLGAFFVKQEGIATLNSLQTKAAKGEMPGTELVEGIFLLIAGVLLVTPGFVTDIFGLLLTFPISRKAFAAFMMKHLQNKQAAGKNAFYFNFHQASQQQPFNQQEYTEKKHSQGDTFEGEYQNTTDKDDRNRIE